MPTRRMGHAFRSIRPFSCGKPPGPVRARPRRHRIGSEHSNAAGAPKTCRPAVEGVYVSRVLQTARAGHRACGISGRRPGQPGQQIDGTRLNHGLYGHRPDCGKAGVQIGRLKFKGLCARAGGRQEKRPAAQSPPPLNLSGQSVRKPCSFISSPRRR